MLRGPAVIAPSRVVSVWSLFVTGWNWMLLPLRIFRTKQRDFDNVVSLGLDGLHDLIARAAG